MQTPRFWLDDTLLSRLLMPLGAVYGAATKWRLANGPSYRAPIPVICVGNVTAGGSGKTPTVQALAKAALARGIQVHCLTRGYGGRMNGPVRVDLNTYSASDVGDEALLLASIAPTFVARDRAAGARAALAAGAQLLILDDGLQNPAVAYDLSLLVIDGGFGLGNGRIIPAGPLREPILEAAKRIGAVLIIGNDRDRVRRLLPAVMPVISAHIAPQSHDLSGKRIVAFSGLGRPEKFYETLVSIGADIVGWFPFPDHHVFTAVDLENLDAARIAAGACLVTSRKDFVRLPPGFRDKVMVLDIDLIPEDPFTWDNLINQAMT